MSPFTFIMCERIRFKFEMMADSDFENFIMKMTIRIMTRKTLRGSGKALVIEMVTAANMVAKISIFSYQ